jgi:hypothetical protein
MAFVLPLITLILIPGMIFLVIIIYKSIYRQHINHALEEDGKTISYIEPFNFMVVTLLIISIIFGVLQHNKLNQLLDDSVRQFNELQNKIDSRSNSLTSKINVLEKTLHDMEERTRWITNKSYEFTNLSEDLNKVTVNVKLSLKELAMDSDVYLVVIDQKDLNQSQKIKLEDRNILSFNEHIPLKIGESYQIDVLTENGVTSKKEHLFDIDLTNWLEDRILDKGMGYSRGKDHKELYLEFSVSNETYGLEELKISQIKIRIYQNQTLLEERDITNAVETSSMGTQEWYKYSETITIDPNQTYRVEVILVDQLGMHPIAFHIN